MTLQTLPGKYAYPGLSEHFPSGTGTTQINLTGSGHYVGYVVRGPLTVSHVWFRTGTVSSTPVGEVRCEAVDMSTGFPIGSLFATDTNITTGALASNTAYYLQLTAPLTLFDGEYAWVGVYWTSGNININGVQSGELRAAMQFPYRAHNVGTPTKATLATGILALGTGASSFNNVRGLLPLTAASGNTFNNTNGARRGLRAQLRHKARIWGLRFYNSSQTSDFYAKLFNDAGTLLTSSGLFDGNLTAAGASGVVYCPFTTPIDVDALTYFRAVVEPDSAGNVNLTTLTLPGAAYRQATPAGEDGHYTTYASSAWDDTNTAILPCLDVLFDKLDDGAGGAAVGRIMGY